MAQDGVREAQRVEGGGGGVHSNEATVLSSDNVDFPSQIAETDNFTKTHEESLTKPARQVRFSEHDIVEKADFNEMDGNDDAKKGKTNDTDYGRLFSDVCGDLVNFAQYAWLDPDMRNILSEAQIEELTVDEIQLLKDALGPGEPHRQHLSFYVQLDLQAQIDNGFETIAKDEDNGNLVIITKGLDNGTKVPSDEDIIKERPYRTTFTFDGQWNSSVENYQKLPKRKRQHDAGAPVYFTVLCKTEADARDAIDIYYEKLHKIHVAELYSPPRVASFAE